MKASKSLQSDLLLRWLESLSPNLRITWEFLSPEQQAAVFAEYRKIVAECYDTPRKFALMAFREHNPKEQLNAPDEALMIGAGVKKLRSLREQSQNNVNA